MNNIHNWLNTVAIALVLAVVLVGGNDQPVQPTVGGSTASYIDAAQGFRVGGTTVIDSSGNVDAPITTTSFSSTDTANLFNGTATTTVQVGAASYPGCLILGDSAGGADPVYITASGATLTAATTTVPAACSTAQ